MNRILFIILITISTLLSCTPPVEDTSTTPPAVPTNQVKLSSQIIWEKLNPARGDKSPQAGTIWGDRKGSPATGFLAKFVDGFSSPPHIHNVTYRAMVIKGLVHNDDPTAEKMWMPPGSFWTQPAGEIHITAAKGEENIAYVEIDSGPYLVKPTDQAFDNGTRPINIDKSNIIWLDATETQLIEPTPSHASPSMSFLWENGGMVGRLLKLPVGYQGKINSEGEEFHAIIISGNLDYTIPRTQEVKSLDPGSYFTSSGISEHQIQVNQGKEVIIYVRTNGKFHIR